MSYHFIQFITASGLTLECIAYAILYFITYKLLKLDEKISDKLLFPITVFLASIITIFYAPEFLKLIGKIFF